ncbi:molybdopterin binding oxidoreductase [Hesseltinella vesiculosa]|uniref:Nitrate reductase [NADPH] n=1 Tax=Hesseltinella vesiculosa TaxID=101127 RepID=A0A1X2G510_9FUNG|nr:molybdopterin binding oxidoreductase [Hesseltinella vesiculosa]
MPVDPKDLKTPDAFVERDPSMIRLTGVHPFNAEPPLSSLEKAGWLTPNELHFVRNHGPVPQVQAESHTLTIRGLIQRPITLTLKDIMTYPRHTIAISMACAGNRRKEQNMYKQSIGFGWGPSGVSTAMWTGVFLRDILNECGVRPECKYVWFEGCDKTQKGAYGTSLPLYRCMSDHFDVMLAFQMNGEWLPPDHGYPLRLIVPGCIGGRSVKWLSTIECSDRESTNVFHDNDNKVFPTQVQSAEQATQEGWWPRPEYTLYDLNINSVITSPAQGEQLDYNTLLQPDKPPHYTLQGYAYTGGNRPLTRVEVTLDNGSTWLLADINTRHDQAMQALQPTLARLETPLDQDKPRFWTWTLWELKVPITSLIRASELAVRAWDVSQNTQPEKMTWNLMGMMNNCWYRVKLEWDRAAALAVQAVHPTLAGPMTGGWMDRQPSQDKTPNPMQATQKTKPDLPWYTLDQIASHDRDDDCWIVVHDKVYDCTPFLHDHPGGASSILICGGADTTEEFDAIHSSKAQTMLEDYLVGYDALVKGFSSSLSLATALSSADDDTVFLQPRQWLDLTLAKKTRLSPTTHVYRFNYPGRAAFGLPTGQHVYLKLYDEAKKMVMRAYTPSASGLGWVEFVIKIYYPFNDQPGGQFTTLLDQVRLGESVPAKGPLGEYEYLGNGDYCILKQPQPRAQHIAMIAGGTGITPMWQVLMEMVTNDLHPPLVSLIFCARFKDDLIYLDALEKMAAQMVMTAFISGN